MTRVRSVMRTHPWTIDVEASLRTALELLEVGGVRHLPVTDDGHLVGIVSDRDLRPWRALLRDVRGGAANLDAEDALAQPIGAVMSRTVFSVTPEVSIEDAVELLREQAIGALPVVEGDTVVGIVSIVDLLGVLSDALAERSSTRRVGDLMTEHVFSVLRTDPVDAALTVLRDHGVRHAPVVDDEGAVVGVVSYGDLVAHAGAHTVGGVMHLPETVSRDTRLVDAAEILVENGFGCVPVVENRRLVGILTESDFVRSVAAG